MANCIAITKKGKACLNSKSKLFSVVANANQPILFCSLHFKKKPDTVLIEGTNKIIPYVNVAQYLDDVNKSNQANQAQHQTSIPARDIHKRVITDIKPICTVCCDEFPNRSDLSECDASATNEYNHLVCRECLKGHVSILLSDGIASLECMFNKHDHCQGQYTEENIKNALDYQDKPAAAAVVDDTPFSKWQVVMAASEIVKFASICENYVICPLCCSWGCIFEIPVGAEKYPFYIRCGNCVKEWCTLCKRGAHCNRSCYELAFNEAELASASIMGSVIDKMIQDIATRALTHCCSICGCSYIKEEGCNLMTCPKCNGMSCFICGIKLYYKGETKYWHFTGHDNADQDARCPLWNNHAGDGQENQGNNAFNIANIEREFSKFISSNEANRRIAKLIGQRIIANYEKDKAFANILKNIKTTVM